MIGNNFCFSGGNGDTKWLSNFRIEPGFKFQQSNSSQSKDYCIL